MDDLDTLAGRLKWARGTTRPEGGDPLSAREMSRRAGLSPGMWSLLEDGERTKPAATTVDAIATLLGVDTGWVLARRGTDPDPGEVAAAVRRCAPSTTLPTTSPEPSPAPATLDRPSHVAVG